VITCAFCGRENASGARFCIDCGRQTVPSSAKAAPAIVNPAAAEQGSKSVAASPIRSSPQPPATRVEPAPGAGEAGSSQISCPRCGRSADASLPFCGHCGARVGSRVSVETPAQTAVFSAARQVGPRLALLDDEGAVDKTFTLDQGEAVIGRGDADIKFPFDVYMSPLHARLEAREGSLWLRDLGSRNRSWAFIDEPARLTDGDVLLVGSQLLRFRRLGYPGPHPPEADSTRRMGSAIPSADVALLEQIRADSSVRDTFHLSPGRPVVLGRENGDWVFPYDQTMSGRHAEIRPEDTEFFVHDAGSRNGVAVAVRGDRQLREGQRILLGDQILRVESL
jgi:pSer/pThr/pTyr-binding forkhead associated (FHA) protein